MLNIKHGDKCVANFESDPATVSFFLDLFVQSKITNLDYEVTDFGGDLPVSTLTLSQVRDLAKQQSLG